MIKNAKSAWKKNNRVECEFTGLKDNRLKYKCKKCHDISAKSVYGLLKVYKNI